MQTALIAESRSTTQNGELSFQFEPACGRVLGEWQLIEDRLGVASITNSAIWTEVWLSVFGDLVDSLFFTARAGTELVGVCLVVFSRHKREYLIPSRSIHLGTAGEPDRDCVVVEHNDLLVDPKSRADFLPALFRAIDSRRDWSSFRLDGVTDSFAAESLSLRDHFEYRKVRSYYFDLDRVRNSSGEILSTLGKSTRSDIRRKLRNVPGVQGEWAESITQADDFFTELIELHQSRWNSVGKPGVFSSPRFTRFHRELILKLWEVRRIELFRARHNNTTLGVNYFHVSGRRLLHYQCGQNITLKDLSPGLILDYLSLEAALTRGYAEFDFLGGDTCHKQKLSTDHNELVWLVCRRPRVWHRLIETLRGFRRKLLSLPRSNQTKTGKSPVSFETAGVP